MSITTRCLAAQDDTGKMIRHTIQRRAVGDADVHIKVRYSGICHSDIHTAKGDWGPQTYPQCVGHEILGDVVAVGSAVTKFKVGDVAGVGCFTDSCRKCEECLEGHEQYCSGGGMLGTYSAPADEKLHPGGKTHGGYSSDMVVDENYVIKIPEKMNVAAAAPLLCAGITCFDPFIQFGIKPGMKVGVAGMGGLGHMAVKIAKAMGADVTVFTRTEAKVETAKAMGASHVVVTSDAAQVKAAEKSMHVIYDSIAAKHDIAGMYLGFLRNRGTLLVVGGVPEPIENLGAFGLLGRGLQLKGTLIGGIKATQTMIDFCAKHDIVSDIELIPATPEAVDVAWDRTIAGDVKYRFVIDTGKTLGDGFPAVE